MREVSRLMQCTKIKLVLFKTTSIIQHINFHAIFKHSKSGIPVSFMDLSIIFHEMDLWLTQAPTILVFHVTWQGKGSMRYGGLMPGRVPACQTEVTWGREWVRVMTSQRRGQRQSGWWDFRKWLVNLSTPEKTITHSFYRHIQNKNLISNRIHDK